MLKVLFSASWIKWNIADLTGNLGFPSGSVIKNPPANARDTGLIRESGRSPGEGSGNPLQCSCLGNCMDRGTWRATAHGVAKESNMTEWLNSNGLKTAQHLRTYYKGRILCPITKVRDGGKCLGRQEGGWKMWCRWTSGSLLHRHHFHRLGEKISKNWKYFTILMEKPFQRECTNVQWQPNWIMDHHSLCIKERFSSVQSLSRVQLFATPWIAVYQAFLSFTNSQSLLKLMSIESVMPSSYLILCRPLLLLPSIPPSIRVFSNESPLRMRWPEYWEFQLQHQSFQWTPRTDFL